MLGAALSAGRRVFFQAAVGSLIVLSLILAGCAGVVSPSGGQNSPTPPSTDLAITSVQASGVTTSSVQLTWATNLPATSAIDYGTSAAYGASTPVNTSMVTTHQMGLASLTRGTTYHYRVRSAAGSSTATSNDQMFSTVGDTTPPTVAITSPASGATLSGNVNVTAVASDDVGVATVQFRVDGGNAGASQTAPPFAFLLDTTSLSNGSHTISAVAADAAGNLTTSAGVAVTVNNTTKDTTPPTVTMTSPASGATVSGPVQVTATAADNVSVASVQFQLDGANLGAAEPAFPYAYTWDSTKTSNGSHALRAIATDGAGNSTTSASVTVMVDNTTKDTTPPTVTITAPAGSAKLSGAVSISATAGDNVSVATVQFQVDGTNIGAADVASPYTYSWDTTKATNGAHTVRAIATDGAGNSTTSAGVAVTVSNTPTDTTPPAVSITAPAGAATVSGTVSVTANASDNVGVANVQFQVDGANAGGLDGATPYAFTWDTTKVSNGAHRLDAIARDAAGNSTTSAIVIVTVNNSTAPQTFSISGTISPTTGGSGATVTLTGPSGATTTTNGAGAYSFTGLANGTYSITPSHTGFTFTPGSQSATIAGANVTGVNFTATAQVAPTFSISGTISPAAGGAGTTVTLTGPSGATTTTNGAGAYTFTGLANGTYSITPSHTGFTFTPGSQSATVAGANVTGINFTATAQVAPTFSVSGTISPAAGGAGATVTLTGPSGATTTTNGAGAYSFTGLANGTYSITPSHTGFTFTPGSQSATVAGANVTGINFSATAQVAPTFSVSGTISPAAGGAGATVTLTGPSGATTTTNGAGAYSFTGLANGTYSITPSQTGFTFSPGSQSATVAGANMTGINFTATAQVAPTFSVSGTISPAAGGAGATVTLTGPSGATTTTNGAGAYSFTGLANGTYSITPSHSGFTFTPGSQSATVAGANVTGVNFTATAQVAPTFSISGTISPAAGGSGATVTLSGPSSATATTNGSGSYTFTGLAPGSYAVTPSHTGYSFSPTSQSAAVSTANVTGINFTATAQAPPTFSISGTISPASGGTGATVILSGAAGATTTTNGSGNYSFTGLANGTYAVAPNNSGFTFTPSSQNVTVNGANQPGVDFTAASQKPPSVSLSWSASTSTVSGYNVYRSTVSGSGYAKLNSSLINGTGFDDTNVQSGTTYFYVTTAVDSGGDESAHSNQASATIP